MFIEIKRGNFHMSKGINLWQIVLLLIIFTVLVEYSDASGCQPIESDTVIGLNNRFIQVEFDLNYRTNDRSKKFDMRR